MPPGVTAVPVFSKAQAAGATAGGEPFHIAAADRAHLIAIANETFPDEDREFHRLLPQTAARARAMASHWPFTAPADTVDQLLQLPYASSRASDPRGRTRLRRVAVARLALEFFRVDDRLTDSIERLYPDFFAQLAKFLLTGTRVE